MWIDCIVLVLLAYGIILGISQKKCSLAKNKMCVLLNKIAFPMYLNHNMFRILMPYYFADFSLCLLILYLLIVTIYSIFTLKVVNYLETCVERRFFDGKDDYSNSSSKGQ